MADHLSSLLFCPTETAVKNLAQEGISKGVRWVGDVMYDLLLWHLSRMDGQAETLLAKLVYIRGPMHWPPFTGQRTPTILSGSGPSSRPWNDWLKEAYR